MKLETGALVDVYDETGELEGRAYLIEQYSEGTAGKWWVRFIGQYLVNIRDISPENAILKPESLQDLLVTYRDLHNRLQPVLNDLENLKQVVKDKAMELGENMEIEGASVQLRDGYSRTSWDGKLLEGLALVYPEIEKCKKVSEVKASVAVTVK